MTFSAKWEGIFKEEFFDFDQKDWFRAVTNPALSLDFHQESGRRWGFVKYFTFFAIHTCIGFILRLQWGD